MATLGGEFGWRGPAGSDQGMKPACRFFGFLPEIGIKNHLLPPSGFAVKKSAGRHLHPEYLLKAEGLGAELHFVAIIFFSFSALIFHWKGQPWLTFAAMELHNIRLAYQPQAKGAKRHGIFNPDSASCPVAAPVGPFMQDIAFCGETVLRPYLLDVNQGALPLAVE